MWDGHHMLAMWIREQRRLLTQNRTARPKRAEMKGEREGENERQSWLVSQLHSGISLHMYPVFFQ